VANALALLHNLGVEVQAIRPGCCQRPRISHGFLDRAKIDGEQTLRALDAYIMQGFDVAVLEPSCFSALTDDLVDLVRDTALADRIKHHVLPLEHLLEKWYEVGRLSATLRGITNEVYIHGHCHQKALRLMQPLLNLYRRAGVKAHLIQAGCCGMAGSFGYEKEHRAISERIAEDRLLPAIRALPEDATLVCSGFSCRHQIADLAGRQALHWVETLKVAP